MSQHTPIENNKNHTCRLSPEKTCLCFCFNIYILHSIMCYCYYIISILPQSLVNFIYTVLLLRKIFIPEAAYLFFCVLYNNIYVKYCMFFALYIVLELCNINQ